MFDTTILLVEDENLDVVDIKQTLESFGYQVPYIASSGEDAVEKTIELMPDLVLMGVNLKGKIDGFEAASQIKYLNVPFIYLANNLDETNLQRVLETEPNACMLQPLDPSELRFNIELAVLQKESENQIINSENAYQKLVDNAMVGIFKSNIHGEILFANDAMVKMFYYDNIEDLKKINILELYKNADSRAYLVRKLKKDKYIKYFETDAVGKNGETIKVLISVNLDDEIISGMFIDITDYKLAKKKLAMSESRYRAVFENSRVLLLIFADDGTIIMFNHEWQRISGYSREEVEGKKWMDFVHPDYRKKMGEYHLQRMKDPQSAPENYETIFMQKNGNSLVMYITVTALPERNRWLVSAIDITELKNTQRKLEKNNLRLTKSEERFRAVAESAVDAIVTTDFDGKIIYFNNSLTNIFGYGKGEMTGKPLTILMPDRFKTDYLNELKKFKISGEHRLIGKTVVTSGLRKDGTEFPFEMSLSAWRSGGKTFFTSIIRDISRQKLAEEQTQDHLKKLTIINKVINTANNASDIRDLLKDVLRSTMELLGFESGGIYLLEQDGVYTNLEYYENLSNAFLNKTKRVKVDEEPYSIVYIQRNPIYNYTEIQPNTANLSGLKSSAAVPLFSAGEVIGSLNVASKEKSFITDLEKDILESIGVQTGTVIAKMYSEEKIKYSLKEKEVLLKEIHHRVKNNLQIISSLLDLQEVYVKEDPMAVNVLMESQNRVLSMAIIHEMLYQSKDISLIDLSAYIRNLVSNLSGSYGAYNINSIIDVEETYLNMETSIPLGLLISELISNSYKYAFPEKQAGELSISLNNTDELYELIIKDNGIGFPKDVDFKNVQSSLGLQLVNSLVNQLDGTIELDRNLGTKFTIKFRELKYKDRI